MRVLARRTATGLVPADQQALDEFKRVAVGKPVYVEIKAVRNPRQHRMLFAMLNIVAEAGEFPSTAAALIALKLATGHVEAVQIDKDGTTQLIPKSVNYANMTKSDWEPWFESAIQVVTQRWLPGMSSEILKAQIEEMVGA